MKQFMDAYATHLPTLLRCVARTNGPVLEMGCGMYSTLALHELCMGRRLVSVETDAEWFSRFEHLRSPWHELHCRGSYDGFGELFSDFYDVVLIDHAPARRRVVDVPRFVGSTFVVLHDSERSVYGYQGVMGLFRYTWTDRSLIPWTTVCSNVVDVRSWDTKRPR